MQAGQGVQERHAALREAEDGDVGGERQHGAGEIILQGVSGEGEAGGILERPAFIAEPLAGSGGGASVGRQRIGAVRAEDGQAGAIQRRAHGGGEADEVIPIGAKTMQTNYGVGGRVGDIGGAN